MHDGAAGPGSSVGTSVRLKIGRSAVRPRPWPPSLSPGFEQRPPAETQVGVLLSGAYPAPSWRACCSQIAHRLPRRPVSGQQGYCVLHLGRRRRPHQVGVDPTRDLRRGVTEDQTARSRWARRPPASASTRHDACRAAGPAASHRPPHVARTRLSPGRAAAVVRRLGRRPGRGPGSRCRRSLGPPAVSRGGG